MRLKSGEFSKHAEGCCKVAAISFEDPAPASYDELLDLLPSGKLLKKLPVAGEVAGAAAGGLGGTLAWPLVSPLGDVVESQMRGRLGPFGNLAGRAIQTAASNAPTTGLIAGATGGHLAGEAAEGIGRRLMKSLLRLRG